MWLLEPSKICIYRLFYSTRPGHNVLAWCCIAVGWVWSVVVGAVYPREAKIRDGAGMECMRENRIPAEKKNEFGEVYTDWRL